MEFKAGDLKNVDIRFKFVSLQCSWVKKLNDGCFHGWKIVPLHLLNKCFGPSFKFHSNLHFESKLLKHFCRCSRYKINLSVNDSNSNEDVLLKACYRPTRN